MQPINHACVVDMKIKRVLGMIGVMRVATLRLCHGNDLAHILDDGFSCRHMTQGEHTFAVHPRG